MSEGRIISIAVVCAVLAIGTALVFLLRPSAETLGQAEGSYDETAAPVSQDQNPELERMRRHLQQLHAELRRVAAENEGLKSENKELSQQYQQLVLAHQRLQDELQQRERREQLALGGLGPQHAQAPHAEAPGGGASISGSAWLTRNDGSSDVLRGLRVYLLPPDVDAPQIRQTFEAARAVSLRHAQEVRQRLEKFPFMSEWEEEAAGHEKVATEVSHHLRRVPRSMPVPQLYQQLRQWRMVASPLFGHLAIASVRTGVDGTYKFEEVEPGSYLVFAEINTRVMYVAWMIPVRIANQALTMDLHNDNTAMIKN
jgi:hypothetical protein